MKYMHKETGSVAEKQDWLDSYSIGELDDRSLTAAECFAEDEGVTLFPVEDVK